MLVVIQKPLITEKTMKLAALGQYTFIVNKDVRKPQIVKEVTSRFGVDVVSIKTMNYKAKDKLQRTRKGHFSVSKFQKAVIVVKAGQKIGIFEEASKPKAEDEETVTVTTAEGEPITEIREKKSRLRGTKVKIEKTNTKKGVK